MASLHYLTVQDMLWINLQTIGFKAQSWHFMKLEEGTFYQYGYGASANLVPQAAKFAAGFAKNAPFADGNEATGLIAVLTFLAMNGKSISLDAEGAVDWYRKAVTGSEDAIASVATDSHDGHHALVPDVRAIAGELLERYAKAVSALSGAAA